MWPVVLRLSDVKFPDLQVLVPRKLEQINFQTQKKCLVYLAPNITILVSGNPIRNIYSLGSRC